MIHTEPRTTVVLELTGLIEANFHLRTQEAFTETIARLVPIIDEGSTERKTLDIRDQAKEFDIFRAEVSGVRVAVYGPLRERIEQLPLGAVPETPHEPF